MTATQPNCSEQGNPHLGFELVVEVGVVEFHEAEEEGPFLGDAVVAGDLFLHVLLEEGHVAQEAAREGPQQLEEQLDLQVVPPAGGGEERLSGDGWTRGSGTRAPPCPW